MIRVPWILPLNHPLRVSINHHYKGHDMGNWIIHIIGETIDEDLAPVISKFVDEIQSLSHKVTQVRLTTDSGEKILPVPSVTPPVAEAPVVEPAPAPVAPEPDAPAPAPAPAPVVEPAPATTPEPPAPIPTVPVDPTAATPA